MTQKMEAVRLEIYFHFLVSSLYHEILELSRFFGLVFSGKEIYI